MCFRLSINLLASVPVLSSATHTKYTATCPASTRYPHSREFQLSHIGVSAPPIGRAIIAAFDMLSHDFTE
jgi:hypothetical protein